LRADAGEFGCEDVACGEAVAGVVDRPRGRVDGVEFGPRAGRDHREAGLGAQRVRQGRAVAGSIGLRGDVDAIGWDEMRDFEEVRLAMRGVGHDGV